MLEQFVSFGEQASVELVERYFAAVDATCLQLVDHPRSGVLYDSALRFFLQPQTGIEVISVFHGARHIDNLFAHEEA